ncbi:MAG: DNA mismatch repair protein MutS, partial [Clostridiales bacterium]|nr:DNA mismatch repair protein MutS [Clostridiales bacterium]
MSELTPMMRQYLTIKEEHPDALLFFRLGDFYEMFFDDAITASRELELTLTGRDCGLPERAPMCGVPWHAADGYIARLVERGYKVAVCEQTEDPALVKGLVKRAIVRVVTPGTVSDLNALNERRNNYIAAVHPVGSRAGLAWCDVTTGEFLATVINDPAQELRAALNMIAPSEVVTSAPDLVKQAVDTFVAPYPAARFAAKAAREKVLAHFQVDNLGALGLTQSEAPATAAVGALLSYLDDMQKASLKHITSLHLVADSDAMPLDLATRRNLELTEGIRSRSVQGALLWLLDKTVTAMGARQLRAWVEQPLTRREPILVRQAQVAALYEQPVLCEELALSLKQVYDMERLLSRVSYGTLNARDCVALIRTLERLPQVRALLSSITEPHMQVVLDQLNPLPDILDLLTRAIEDDPPLSTTEGGIIRDGYSKELDEVRAATREGAQWLTDLELREREATGIKNLRVQYNRVFGY